jgi:RNA polymerase sigma factor (sigma-70 family)
MTHPPTPERADAPGPAVTAPAVNKPPSPDPSGPGPGGEHDFAGFYRGHFRRLVAYLLYQGAPAHVAAELAQEAMITAYQRWDTITTPRTYVWTVAYRAFIRHALHKDEQPVAEVPEPTAVLPHPEDAETWLQEQEITGMLRALPSRQRQVLALTLDGWPPAQIAGLLDIDPSAARSNLKKARRNAAEYLRRTGEENP